MSLAITAKSLNNEFNVIKSKVEKYDQRTSLGTVAEAKQKLTTMQAQITEILIKNATAVTALVVPTKGIPTLLERCNALLPKESAQIDPTFETKASSNQSKTAGKVHPKIASIRKKDQTKDSRFDAQQAFQKRFMAKDTCSSFPEANIAAVQRGSMDNRDLEIGKTQESMPAHVCSFVPAVIHCEPGGRKLFIRGTGPGMSWEKGIELVQVDGKWVFEIQLEFNLFEFKVLLDDQQWEQGENHEAKSGKTLEIVPRF